jgi:hypothetical protein
MSYSGPMCDMGSEEYVTQGHRFWWRYGWVRAEHSSSSNCRKSRV